MISAQILETTLFYVAVSALLLVNAACVFLVVLQLPGTWAMLGVTGLFAWWQWDALPEQRVIGWWVLAFLLILALIGELLEFAGGSIGAASAGSSKWGALGALIGGVAGAIIGTFLIPIPIIGTLVGACLGAAIGSVLGNWPTGMRGDDLYKAAKGAAAGKLWGTVAKVAVAALMWLLITVAVFWN